MIIIIQCDSSYFGCYTVKNADQELKTLPSKIVIRVRVSKNNFQPLYK